MKEIACVIDIRKCTNMYDFHISHEALAVNPLNCSRQTEKNNQLKTYKGGTNTSHN